MASVGNLETYGLFPDMKDEALRKFALDTFAKMYGRLGRQGPCDGLPRQTGRDALKGADILRTAPGMYESTVEYAANPIAQSMRSVAQVMFADLGTRIYYTAHGSFDTHSGEIATHEKLWTDVSGAIGDFMDDLKAHGRENDAIIFLFSEFGRRIKDNGSGTDHGSGGVAFIIGDAVQGGMYGEYPSIKQEDQLEGDLHFNNDFRHTYTTILESWLGLEAAPIVNGPVRAPGVYGQLARSAEDSRRTWGRSADRPLWPVSGQHRDPTGGESMSSKEIALMAHLMPPRRLRGHPGRAGEVRRQGIRVDRR